MKIFKATTLLLLSKYRYLLRRPLKMLLLLLVFFVYLNSMKFIKIPNSNLSSQDIILLANILAVVYCSILLLAFHIMNFILKSIPYESLYTSPNSLFINNLQYSKEVFISKSISTYVDFTIFTLIIFSYAVSNSFYKLLVLKLILISNAILILYLPYKISKTNSNTLFPTFTIIILIIYGLYNLLKFQPWFISNIFLSFFRDQSITLLINNILKFVLLIFLIILSSKVPYLKISNLEIKTIKVNFTTPIKLANWLFTINSFYKKIYSYLNITGLQNKIIQSIYFFVLSSTYSLKKFLKIVSASLALFVIFLILSSILWRSETNLELLLIISVGYFIYNLCYSILLPNINNIGFLLNLNKNKKILHKILLSLTIYTFILSSIITVILIFISKVFFNHYFLKISFIKFLLLLSFLNFISIFWSIVLTKISSRPDSSSFAENNLSFMGYIWICLVPTIFLVKLLETNPVLSYLLILLLNFLVHKVNLYLYNSVFLRR